MAGHWHNTATLRLVIHALYFLSRAISIGAGQDLLALNLTILVGTMTGTAEMVAQEVQTVLEAAGHTVSIRLMDDLDASVFQPGGTFLICTSTYGQGDVPDNAQEFFASLEREGPDLSRIAYGLIALGDLTYKDTFCEGGIRFDRLLSELGARRIGEVLKHDASSGTLPEEVAAQWIVPWAQGTDAVRTEVRTEEKVGKEDSSRAEAGSE